MLIKYKIINEKNEIVEKKVDPPTLHYKLLLIGLLGRYSENRAIPNRHTLIAEDNAVIDTSNSLTAICDRCTFNFHVFDSNSVKIAIGMGTTPFSPTNNKLINKIAEALVPSSNITVITKNENVEITLFRSISLTSQQTINEIGLFFLIYCVVGGIVTSKWILVSRDVLSQGITGTNFTIEYKIII